MTNFPAMQVIVWCNIRPLWTNFRPNEIGKFIFESSKIFYMKNKTVLGMAGITIILIAIYMIWFMPKTTPPEYIPVYCMEEVSGVNTIVNTIPCTSDADCTFEKMEASCLEGSSILNSLIECGPIFSCQAGTCKQECGI